MVRSVNLTQVYKNLHQKYNIHELMRPFERLS